MALYTNRCWWSGRAAQKKITVERWVGRQRGGLEMNNTAVAMVERHSALLMNKKVAALGQEDDAVHYKPTNRSGGGGGGGAAHSKLTDRSGGGSKAAQCT